MNEIATSDDASPQVAPATASVSNLGRLERVDVRDYWPDEARDFTPWLAEAENLVLLSQAIEMDLEPWRTEERIGPFRADIVAKEGDDLVIVENQLAPTDHRHLGQLMVYATNRQAKAVVWIATLITDEYRKVLDWLNENTPEAISFFGLEIELWRIGDSVPAPKFNVVCKPNELTKIERGGNSEPTETKLLQLDFWKALKERGESAGSPVAFRKPRAQHWAPLAVGRSGFQLSLTLNSFNQRIGCELYISHPEAELAFNLLEQQKEALEQELGPLEWHELPNKHARRIIQFHDGDISDRESWPAQQEWLLQRAEAFTRCFGLRVQSLDLDTPAEPEERD